MNKLLIASITSFVLGLFLIVLYFNSETSITGNAILEDGVKVFAVTGENYRFLLEGIENPDIIVNKGDTVRVEFSSTEGFHDWVLDEFNAATEKVRENSNLTFVEFVVDKEGTFEYYCSVGKHREGGMKGKFIVN